MPATGFTCILRNECVSSGQAQTTANDQTWCVAVPSGAAKVTRNRYLFIIAKLSRKRALHFDQLSTPWGPEPAMDLVAAMQLVAAKSTELTNQAAEVEPVVDALVKAHVEFEVRLGRFKKAITK